MPIVRRKAFAYITHRDRLLVFTHPLSPEAGIQVPAGTLEDGEEPEVGALREASEETGLSGLEIGAFLGEQIKDLSDVGLDEIHHRYFYHLRCPGEPPDRWRHVETDPSDGGSPIPFDFFWARLPDEVPDLIADHGCFLPVLLNSRSKGETTNARHERTDGALTIRRYEEADYDEVWALHNLALHSVGAHAGNGPWDDDLHDVGSVYLDNRGEFTVGVVDGQIVAMGGLKRRTDYCAEIVRMRVHPDFQRRGFGHALLGVLETRARELGYRSLRLDTTVQQVAAQRLYQKHGFREIGRATIAGFDCILYEKTFTVP